MQRWLMLMRHAKAIESRRDGDHGRELTSTGRDDAQEIAQILRSSDLSPDLVLCSNSRRTVETASAVVGPQNGARSIIELPDLYLADAMTIVRAIGEYGAGARHLLIVGHNPAIESLVQTIDPSVARVKPGTALLCSVDREIPWHQFTPSAATPYKLLAPSRYAVDKDQA